MRSGRSSLMNGSGGSWGSAGWLCRVRLGRGLVGFESGMGCCEAGDWNAVGRAGDVIEADRMAEFHGARLATVLTTDTDLELRTDLATGRYGESNQFSNPVLVQDLERIVGKYTTIHVVG